VIASVPTAGASVATDVVNGTDAVAAAVPHAPDTSGPDVADVIVELKNVNKVYDGVTVVRDLNLSVRAGEFLTLLGPSGCGKTTTLRMIAGFETATAGDILLQGVHVEDQEPFERDVNTVFQSYALFPHMTVAANVEYGLKMKKVPRAERATRVTEMLDLVQLGGFENRYPAQLSGGQKQRVAIARALINQPKVLLLDEPLGALDLKLRKQMQVELKRLQRKLNITFIYVTHDQEEALTMSDRIAIMHDGVLEQLGTPVQIYDRPASKFAATFIGETNLFEGYVADLTPDRAEIVIESGRIAVELPDDSVPGKPAFGPEDLVAVSIRPEKVRFSATPVPDFVLAGQVKDVIYAGSFASALVTIPNGSEVRIQRRAGEALPQPGETVHLYWELADAVPILGQSGVVFDTIIAATLATDEAAADALNATPGAVKRDAFDVAAATNDATDPDLQREQSEQREYVDRAPTDAGTHSTDLHRRQAG
jgi:spermidine/putrescine transport system ATP-binding protein